MMIRRLRPSSRLLTALSPGGTSDLTASTRLHTEVTPFRRNDTNKLLRIWSTETTIRSVTDFTHRNESSYTNASNRDWHHPSFLSDLDVKKKEAWLESLLSSNETYVDVEAFLVVLNALASQSPNDAGAARRAERWMNRLKSLRDDLQPTAECYQAVIQAWANSKNDKNEIVVNRAERWLNELIKNAESNPNLSPTIDCYNAFLEACTKGRGGGTEKRQQLLVKKHALKAEALLRQIHYQWKQSGDSAILVPNTETFNFVIRGWTRCRRDDSIGHRVLNLLRTMEAHQREDPVNSPVRPNTKSYAMTMDALTAIAKIKASSCIEDGRKWNPDPSQNGLDEIQEVEAILSYMRDLYEAGVEGVVPHTVPYNILINGWASLARFKHRDAPFKAEQTLREMIHLEEGGFYEAGPDNVSYEKVILAWAQSGHPNAGRRAHWWLKKLWSDYELEKDRSLLPTCHTYNTVIQALAASEGAEAAENLLLNLGHRFEDEQQPELRPNSESFSRVIRAWLVRAEEHPDIDERIRCLRRAIEWLLSLRRAENESDLSTAPELFNGVLKAAIGCSKGRREVLDMAAQVFQDLKKSRHGADSFSYSVLLKVGLSALSGAEDNDARALFVSNLVEECCDEGQLSSAFIQALSNSPVYHNGGWTQKERSRVTKVYFSEWPLPVSWTRNVRNKRLLPKRSDTQGAAPLFRWFKRQSRTVILPRRHKLRDYLENRAQNGYGQASLATTFRSIHTNLQKQKRSFSGRRKSLLWQTIGGQLWRSNHSPFQE